MSAISIVIPCFNNDKEIEKTINSVKQQTFTDFDCVIVDDHSTDNTYDKVLELIAADQRFCLQKRASSLKGANACRNQGYLSANSDLIVFLDADDRLLPDCLEKRCQSLDSPPTADCNVFNSYVYYEAHNKKIVFNSYSRNALKCFLSGIYLWHTTSAVWSRSFLESIGGWDESLMRLQDIDLNIRALKKESFTYRVHILKRPDNLHIKPPVEEVSLEKTKNKEKGYFQFFRKHVGDKEHIKYLFNTYLLYVRKAKLINYNYKPVLDVFTPLSLSQKLRLKLCSSNIKLLNHLENISHFRFLIHNLHRLALTLFFR